MEEFKELGIVRIARKNKTVIERQTKRGTVIVNRNEDTFPPRREFKESANRSVDFSNAFFNEPEVLNFAKKLYVAAADYFDGKNAQMEFSEIEKN